MSKQQSEYFENSKIRDDDGNLIVVYHGTYEDFNVFDSSKTRANMDIQGNFFSPWKLDAEGYGPNVKAYYLNIKNPASESVAYEALNMFSRQNEAGKKAREYLISQGYDGVNNSNEEYIAFYPEQIKRIDNYEPTKNPDIRFSLGDKADTKNTDSNSTDGKIDDSSSAQDLQDTTTLGQELAGEQQTLDEQIQGDYQKNIDTYKAFKPGGEPRVDRVVPKATDKGKNSEFARNLAESQTINDENYKSFKKAVNDGAFAYVQSENKALYNDALSKIERVGVDSLFDEVMNNKNVNARVVVEEFALLNKMSRENDPRLMELASKVATDSTMAGQTLQAFNILKRLTPEGQWMAITRSVQNLQESLVQQWGNEAPEIKIPDNLRQEFEQATNEEERAEARRHIQEAIDEQVPVSVWDKINSWRYLSMLANPTTHIRNILGNAVFAPIVDLKNAIGAAIESGMEKTNWKAVNKKNGAETRLEERTKTLYNPFSKEYKELKKYGSEVYKEYQSTLQEGNKYEKRSLNGIIGKINDFNSLLLDKEDFIFSKSRFINSYAQYLMANNIDGSNITDEQKEKAVAYATLEAQKATYRDFNTVADYLNKLEKPGNKDLGMKTLSFMKKAELPFTKTPLNIARRGVEYSPVGLIKTIAYDSSQLKKGKINATTYVDNLASGLSGTAIALLGALLASLGIFHTKDDDNDRKQNFDEDNGEQEYSIKIGDGSYTLDWLSPSIIPLSIGAELYNVFHDMEDGGLVGNAIEGVTDVALKVLEPIFNTTTLSELRKAFKSYADSDAEYFANIFSSAVKSYVSQFVPTIGSKIAKTFDETRRTTYPNSGTLDSTIKTILNKTPIASKALEPYINLSGEEEKNTGGSFFGRLAYNMLSPGYYKANTTDEYDQEYYRLYESTGSSDVFPSNTKKYVNYEGEQYDFSDSDYTEWNKTRWSKEKELVDEFIDSESYQYYTDEERVSTIKSLRSYAGEIAKKEFLESRGIDYEEKSYTNVQQAEENGVDVFKYFLTKNYYSDLSGDDKKSDYIDYLNDSDMSSQAKNYMYSMEYGTSKSYSYVQDLETDDDTKFKIYEIIADTKADVDEDGNTVSNSKAKKIREQYEQLGVYDSIIEYVNTHEDVSLSSFGLTKTVVAQSSSSSSKKTSSKSSSSSKSNSSASTSKSTTKGTISMASSKDAKLSTQNSSSGISSTSSSSNSNNSLNLKNFTGANTVLNSNSKGTISQASEGVLDDEYLNAYSKIFRNALTKA